MKQINFSHEGGFPLEQETLERLQTAYRSELFGALKAHLSIDTQTDYILAPATINTKGWAVIRIKEKDPKDPAGGTKMQGILYPIKEAAPTGFLKATRTGTNLVYGTGVSQTAYFDYEAEYISAQDYTNRPESPENSDATTVNYYDLAQFQIVKDRKAIEGILEAINANIDAIERNIGTIESNIDSVETAINVINQTYLPLDGSKAMTGDFSMSSKRLLQPTNSTGRALVNSSDTIISSLSLNYQSDWQNTSIGGKVYLENLSTTNSVGSLLVIDDYHQVTKSNSLPELLNRITVLESKISTATAAVPIGMVAIWGKPAPFPDGWKEYLPLRGRMPLGLNPDDPDFSRLRDFAGSKTKKLEVYEIPSHSHNFVSDNNALEDGLRFGSNESYQTGVASQKTEETGGGQPFSIMNPHTVIYFIEYTGLSSDTTAPTSPTNLIVSNIGTTGITLSWTASSDNVAVSDYILYQSGAVPLQLGNVLSHNVSGLSPGTNYSFYVIAQDSANNSSIASNIVNATTTSIVEPTGPIIPRYINARFTGVNRILINWSIEPNNTGNVLYQILTGDRYFENYVAIGQTYENGYIDLNVTKYNSYYYKLRIINEAGEPLSDFSQILEVKANPSLEDE
ncbi:fibronectin type III domain-containing protein [Flavobacterium sp.]|uniref:fibronectin type III domain-containing protein n=1 Tax=Flavobacterium sp. TaxID=239 RepID=UPI00374DD283